MKMSSPERRRFEGRSVAQHRPQDIDATARQGDQGLGVPLALRSLAVVESPGGGCAAETSKGRLPEDPLEDLIPPRIRRLLPVRLPESWAAGTSPA